jgi:hypothetical protein
MGEIRNPYRILVGRLKEWEVLRKIILKWI